MARYEFAKAGAKAKLLDELFAGGITDAVVEMDDAKVWVTTTATLAAVQAIVDAHDPAAIDAADAAKRQQFLSDVALLKSYQTGTPTAADTVKAVRAQSRVLARIVAELRD